MTVLLLGLVFSGYVWSRFGLDGLPLDESNVTEGTMCDLQEAKAEGNASDMLTCGRLFGR